MRKPNTTTASRRLKGCIGPSSSTTPAAWASSRTSRASAATRSSIDAEEVLCNMDHRGACGAKPTRATAPASSPALPHEFLAKVAKAELGVDCRRPGKFAAGIVFLPHDAAERERCKAIGRSSSCAEQGQSARRLARRADATPTRPTSAHGARAAEPHIEQLFIAAGDGLRGRRVRAPALPDPQARQPPAPRRRVAAQAKHVLRLLAVDQGDHLQGHAHDRAALQVSIPDLARPGLHQPPGDGPLAVLDEHVPLAGTALSRAGS